MPADTVRSSQFLLSKVVANQPYPDGQTTNLAQLTRDMIATLQPAFNSASYSFNLAAGEVVVLTAGVVNPSRALVAGQTNTVRLQTVPMGVTGADVAHYLYIVDPGGTNEAVLITGGTAVAGGSNQTLTFVPAFNHSGSVWVLLSATDGIQEGINVVGPLGGRLEIPGGSHTIYAKITCPYSMSIRGAGGFQVTNLAMATGFVTRAMEFSTTAGTRVDVGDFSITYSTNGTSQEALYFKNISDGLLSNFEVINAYNAVTLVSVARFVATGFALLPRNNGFDVSSDPASIVSTVSVPIITNGYVSMQSGVGAVFTVGASIAGMIISGVNSALGQYAISYSASSGAVNEVTVSPDCIFDSLAGAVVNIDLSGSATASRWALRGMYSLTAAATTGLLIKTTTLGNISGFTMDFTLVGNNAALNGMNIQGLRGANIRAIINNNVALGNAIILTGVVCTDITISGGLIGSGSLYNTTNQMNYGVYVDAQAHTRIVVVGNKTYGATAQVSNNSTVGAGAVQWDTF